MATSPPFFSVQFLAPGGEPAALYRLYTYETGTTTPKVSFVDQAEVAQNTNPIILDGDGRCNLWLGTGEYAFELRTPADALVERWDDISGVPAVASTAFVPLAGGVTMTGQYSLSGPATSGLQPPTLTQVQDLIAASAASSSTAYIAADTALQASITAAYTAAISAATAPIIAVNTTQSTDIATLQSQVAALQASSGSTVGTILAWALNSVPTGFLALEGQLVSRTTYATLFALWGSTFGAGDGSTTFGLPDLRGHFVRGWDNGRGIDVGRTIGSAQAEDFKAHTHGIRSDDGDGFNPSSPTGQVRGTDRGLQVTVNSNSAGGVETRPVNTAMRFIVRAL